MKRLLLKISGEVFSNHSTAVAGAHASSANNRIQALIRQIKLLTEKYSVGIVMGGGNIVRGKEIIDQLHVQEKTGHQMGMLATIINGLSLQDLLMQAGIPTAVLSGVEVPAVVDLVNDKAIETTFEKKGVVVFVGGTGQPYFTTDTAAVLYALRMSADELWKCTKVDGVYDADPFSNTHAVHKAVVTYDEFLSKQYGVMDATAVALAKNYALPMRVFTMYEHDALLKADQDNTWGSWIQK